LEDGKVIFSEASGWMEMSGEWENPRLTLDPSTPQSQTVTVKYRTPRASCLSYSLDWGDDSPKDERIQPPRSLCGEDWGDAYLAFSHRYSKPGKYRIIMRNDDFGLGRSLKEIAGYNVIVLTVPR